MIFDEECDLLEDEYQNCYQCHRYSICEKWFKAPTPTEALRSAYESDVGEDCRLTPKNITF